MLKKYCSVRDLNLSHSKLLPASNPSLLVSSFLASLETSVTARYGI